MKSVFKKHQTVLFVLIVCLFQLKSFVINTYSQSYDQELEISIDWQTFMVEQDLVWDLFPGRWENAPFNGNGIVGSMIYASPDSGSIKLMLCRSDIGKLDYPGHYRQGNRIQLGSIDLKTKGKILFDQSTARLNLWDAEITAQIKTTKGAFKIKTFVVLNEPAIIIETFDFEGNENSNVWQTNFENGGKQSIEKNINIFEVKDTAYHNRSKTESGGHVIAWKEKRTNNKNTLIVSINSSPVTHSIWNKSERGQLSAKEDALLTFSNLEKKSTEELFDIQAKWWHNFYSKSFISFQQKELESYYWIQLYKMASSSRKDYPMIDNHGVWSVDSVYGFATWDLNVQIIYRLHLASNHLEMGEPLVRFLDDNFNQKTMYIDSFGEMRAGMRQQTFLRYHYFDPISWEHGQNSPCDGPAKFLWGCHNYWLQFQYSQDSSLLPNLRDKLEGGINAMKAGMEMMEDGKWHIPYGHSWETWKGKDPNAHLGVLNWSLKTIIELEKNLAKLDEWKAFQSEITDYIIGNNGYMLGEGQEAKQHRHWSHLLHLYPLRTTKWEENKELYKKSVDTWTDLASGINGKTAKAGYSPCGAICLYAQMGQTNRLDSLLNIFQFKRSSRGPNIWASTMYREHGPVIETPLFFAASLHELFLQSHEDTIKVFPAMPKNFEDIVFHNFRAEGGFVVSAKRINGKCVFIKITSLHGHKLTLETDIENMEILENENALVQVKKNIYSISLEKNQSILIFNNNLKKELTVEKVKNQIGNSNTYGLNERFFEKREYIKAFQFEGR